VPLTHAGAEAIDALAERWRSAGPSALAGTPARVVSSDLRRASESADIIAAKWKLSVEHDANLREMAFGEWDGRLWSSIEANDGARLRAWTEAWTDTPAPGGEGLGDVARRAGSWLGELLGEPHPAVTIAVVSHAGWIRAALCHLFRLPPSEIFRFTVDHARATVVSVRPSGADLIASNVAEVP
jgi:broad specificity phosphatase PhoE